LKFIKFAWKPFLNSLSKTYFIVFRQKSQGITPIIGVNMIDKQVFVNRVAILQCNTNTQHLLSGNITPHEWYQKFTNSRGVPDLSLMSVLSEIVYWYRPKRVKDPNTMAVTYVNKFSGDAWQTSYEHFEKKFNFNREKIRRIFVKLEQMGICAREFRTVKLKGQTYNNRLFIHLSLEFLSSCTGNKRQISDYESCNASLSAPQNEGGSPHFEGDYIIDIKNKNININKSRSIKSNFSQNSFFKEEEGEFRAQVNSATVLPQHKTPVLQLKDFYPLTSEDATSLQNSSGREFSLNAMNEILLDMSKRVKDRWFKSKKGFLSYMSIAFRNEMREVCKINNESFRIRSNKTTEEITIQKQEEFLSQIEYSLQVSPEWHLRKKLCAVLEREKAYNLLSSYKHCRLEGNIFEMYLTKHVELTSLDRDIILNQVKATHELYDLANNNHVIITSLKIIAPEVDQSKLQPPHAKAGSIQAVGQGTVLPTGIWGNIRQALIDHHDSYGMAGEALDRSWFSKLESEVDEQKKTVKLKAPSKFFKDWINTNYGKILDRLTGKHQYSYEIC
jgi:hypothetical protein